MRREEVAWLAGLLEGDGCFARNASNRAMRVRISMTDRDVLETCHRVTGMGKVTGPYGASYRPTPMYVWEVARRNDAYALMIMVWPFMHQRRREAIGRCIDWWKAQPVLKRLRSACIHGHEFTPDNTYIKPNGSR